MTDRAFRDVTLGNPGPRSLLTTVGRRFFARPKVPFEPRTRRTERVVPECGTVL
jgi:hypothetical protein